MKWNFNFTAQKYWSECYVHMPGPSPGRQTVYLSAILPSAAKYHHKQRPKRICTAARNTLLPCNCHCFHALGTAHTDDHWSTSPPTERNTLLSRFIAVIREHAHTGYNAQCGFCSNILLHGLQQAYIVLSIKMLSRPSQHTSPLCRHFQRLVYSREKMTSSTSRQPWNVNNSITSDCLLGNDLSNLLDISVVWFFH